MKPIRNAGTITAVTIATPIMTKIRATAADLESSIINNNEAQKRPIKFPLTL